MPAKRDAIILEELDRWREADLIDERLYQTLRKRYTEPSLDITTIIKWVLIFGAIVLGGGIVLLFSDVFRHLPEFILVLLLTVLTGGFFVFGYRLSARQRWTLVYSGRALVFVGAITTVIDLIWISRLLNLGGNHWPLLVAVAALIYFTVSYLMQDLLLLVLGIIAATFWFGAETGYLSGWEAYWLGLNYPFRFVGFGVALLVTGWLHERQARQSSLELWSEYSRIYLSLGLLTLLIALWLISLMGNGDDPNLFRAASGLARFFYVMLFTLVSGVVVYLGIKRHDKLFMGYGAVFLCIDIYTRFFEHFWNTLSKSLFFIGLGALSLGIGIFLEYSRRHKDEWSLEQP